VERGTGRACKDDLPDGHSEIFLRRGLDDPNQSGTIEEISFYAHATPADLEGRLMAIVGVTGSPEKLLCGQAVLCTTTALRLLQVL